MFLKNKDVKQKYIWIAEYINGEYFHEFESENKENSFYDIKKDELKRFGLAGPELMFFDCSTGVFYINEDKFEILYKVNDNVYPFTDTDSKDIITYKKAYSEANFNEKNNIFTNYIAAFYFGYKKEITVEDIEFNFKIIVEKDISEKRTMDLSLVCNRDLDGRLVILKNGEEYKNFKAPLKKNINSGVAVDI